MVALVDIIYLIQNSRFKLLLFLQELKLNSLLVEEVEQLVVLLHQLAVDLRCSLYIDYYCRDFPKLLDVADNPSQIKDGEISFHIMFTFTKT